MVGATQVSLHTASWREAPRFQCLLYLVTVLSSIGWDIPGFPLWVYLFLPKISKPTAEAAI